MLKIVAGIWPSKLFFRQIQNLKVRHIAYLCRKLAAQEVVRQIQMLKVWQIADCRRELAEQDGVPQIQILKVRQVAYPGREIPQIIIIHIQSFQLC